MSITQTVWKKVTVNGFMVMTCTFKSDAALYDTYTLKTPAGSVDGTKPFCMFLSAAATLDASDAVPLEVWVGYDDPFAITEDTPMVGVDGAFFKALTEDCKLAVTTVEHVFMIHPNMIVADVVAIANILTGYKVNVPAAPYYAFAINGVTAISADLITCRVVQKQ